MEISVSKIDLLLEKYMKGSKTIKLFSKTYEGAYGESLDLIYDIFGYEIRYLTIDIKGMRGDVDFYDLDKVLLAKMKKKEDKFLLITITE